MQTWQKIRKCCCLFAFALSFFSTGAAWTASTPPVPLRCEAPDWLLHSIKGSMTAVWRELMGSRIEKQTAVEALALVASRLYTGFSVSLVHGEVFLKPERRYDWRVELHQPEGGERLPEEPRQWLFSDLESIKPRLQKLLDGVPPDALQWSSESFKSQVDAVFEQMMPGWRPALRVSTETFRAELEVALYPKQPLMLAVSVETLSKTIPQLLVDRLSEKTLEELSPLTGFPVEWLDFHKKSLAAWLGVQQKENKWLRALRTKSENDINLKTVTKVSSQIDSTTYSLRGWVSGHAGSEAKLQAGIHIGRFFTLSRSVQAELYAETLLNLRDWHFDGRLGLRFSPLRSLWLGIEASTEEESDLWYRLYVEPARSPLYAWLRLSKDEDLESALGYRLNRYISLELYYESKQKDRFSLRALSNL